MLIASMFCVIKARFQSLVYLTAYATTFRYPKEGGRLPAQPSEEEIDEGVAKIKSILDDAVNHFGVDINASDNVPAKNSAPLRIKSRLPTGCPCPGCNDRMMGGGPSRGNADSNDVRKNVRNGAVLAADGETGGAKKIGPMSREMFSFCARSIA